MRFASDHADDHPLSAFAARRELALGRLAIHEKFARGGEAIRGERAGRALFLTDDKEEIDAFLPGVGQSLGGDHHRRGDPFAVVVDASHPFATRVSGDLAVACQREVVPLWRLQRSCLPIGKAELLPNLNALAQLSLDGVPLLLALGARHLSRAVAASPGAIHHARVLPNVQALQLALAARLEPARLACLRPGGDFAIEEALVRRWGIRAVLCRQSGGLTETGWRGIAESMGLRLLLLARPAEPDPGRCLGMEDLLRTLQAVRGALIP